MRYVDAPVLFPAEVSICERNMRAEEAIVADDVSRGGVGEAGALKSLKPEAVVSKVQALKDLGDEPEGNFVIRREMIEIVLCHTTGSVKILLIPCPIVHCRQEDSKHSRSCLGLHVFYSLDVKPYMAQA